MKFSVNNEGEDVNKKSRSTAKLTPIARDRGTEEQETGISEA